MVSCSTDSSHLSDKTLKENTVILETADLLKKIKKMNFLGLMQGKNDKGELVKGFTVEMKKM
ncbi:MAG: hypothetical protein JXA99_11800 [Candidatus Lokiarchaeota archaeon]|nr:hypothetical protein [Candidatus Lokiarchaeota archaeon]